MRCHSRRVVIPGVFMSARNSGFKVGREVVSFRSPEKCPALSILFGFQAANDLTRHKLSFRLSPNRHKDVRHLSSPTVPPAPTCVRVSRGETQSRRVNIESEGGEIGLKCNIVLDLASWYDHEGGFRGAAENRPNSHAVSMTLSKRAAGSPLRNS